jgi:hypothetical protein
MLLVNRVSEKSIEIQFVRVITRTKGAAISWCIDDLDGQKKKNSILKLPTKE